MKRLVLLLLFLSLTSIPSFAQFHIKDDGMEYYYYSSEGVGIGEILFRFRVIYDRYPSDKKEILSFHSNEYKHDYGDSLMNSIQAPKYKWEASYIENNSNWYYSSGDSCLFYLSEGKCLIQCKGGVEDLLRIDYEAFRLWLSTCCYDCSGRYIKSLYTMSPSLSLETSKLFRYYVLMKAVYPESDFQMIRNEMGAALIPFTMTKSGDFQYDLSLLDGIPLFYQAYGVSSGTKPIGPVSIKDAICVEYISAVKEYMMSFMRAHPEVDRMRIWEAIRFNNAPLHH